MNRSKSVRCWRLAVLPMLLTAVATANAVPPSPDIDLSTCVASPPSPISYAAAPGTTVSAAFVAASGPATPIKWSLPAFSGGCTAPGTSAACFPSATDHTTPLLAASSFTGAQVPATTPIQIASPATPAITAADVGASGSFTAQVSFGNLFAKQCQRRYDLSITSSGGGWGDPHLTTIDGAHYDFQSAGEFTALRGPGFELQTRQTPVSTSYIPAASAYSGIRSCVALYTAVATRIASNRVTLEPRVDGVADPSGMELRVNGQLVKLTADGIDLYGPASDDKHAVRHVEGHISMGADGGLQIVDAKGTQLVVGPAYWDAQQLWYLNVNVFQTTATQGTMGRLSPDGWLPALPDGTSLGYKPESEEERYRVLFGRFADAWRVDATSSLFDYAPGTSTATFTVPDWPRNNPQSCKVEGRPVAAPVSESAASEACGQVKDGTHHSDCVFDVVATGNEQIAKTYEAMERVKPTGPGWQNPDLGTQPAGGQTAANWWWLLLLLLVLLIVAVILLVRRPAAP